MHALTQELRPLLRFFYLASILLFSNVGTAVCSETTSEESTSADATLDFGHQCVQALREIERRPRAVLTGRLDKPITVLQFADSDFEARRSHLLSIAQSAQRHGDLESARQFYVQILEECQQVYPVGDWRLRDAQLDLELNDQVAAFSPQDRAALLEAGRLKARIAERLYSSADSIKSEDFQRILEIQSGILGDEHVQCVYTHLLMMKWLVTTEQYREVRELASTTLEELIEIHGEVHPLTEHLLWDMGKAEVGLGERELADEHFRRALHISYETSLGPEDYPKSLMFLALEYDRQGRTTEEEQLLLEANEIRRQTRTDGSYDYSLALYALATLYLDADQCELAKPALLELVQRGDEQPKQLLMKALADLAGIALQQGHVEEAEHYLSDSRSLAVEIEGRSGQFYGELLLVQANTLIRRNQYQLALAVLEEAAGVCKLHDAEAPELYWSCLQQTTQIHLRSGHTSEARRCGEKLTEWHRLRLEPQHPLMACDLSLQSRIELVEGEIEKAEAHAREAITQLATLADCEPERSYCHHALGDILASQRRFYEAAQQYQAALNLQTDFDQSGDQQTLYLLESYAPVLRELGHQQEAAECEARAAAYRGLGAEGNAQHP